MEFRKELIDTFELIIKVIKYNGDSSIVNKKRIDTYKNAVMHVLEYSSNDMSKDSMYKKLNGILTKKPCEIMKDIYNGYDVELEDKSPYNGVVISKGSLVDKELIDALVAFDNLTELTGLGIGIGDRMVRQLVDKKFKTLGDLQVVYNANKFDDLPKSLKGPLCKYFEGIKREEKMPRETATKWKNTIDSVLESIDGDIEFKYKIVGSYARRKEEIGDIDYIVTCDGNKELYTLLNAILDKLSEISDVGGIKVKLNRVDEIPARPKTGLRYTTSTKMWFTMKPNKKVKVEIYGYSIPDNQFIFPYFARAADTELQKSMKIHAAKQGYKLSPWAIDIRDTDTPVDKELVYKKLGKYTFDLISDVYKFLEYTR